MLSVLLITFPFFALVLCGYVAAQRGLLPLEAPDYYTEHLVLPGGVDEVSSAGRIVVGQGGEAYWTADGGVSFARIGP